MSSPNIEHHESALTDRHVLLTGATGVLGSRLLGLLQSRGAAVTASIRPGTALACVANARIVEADIVVDQLNYGRLGRRARESLMLCRPLITSMKQGRGPKLPYLATVPVRHADEETIYGVAKSADQ